MRIDADRHIDAALAELVPFVDEPWRRQVASAGPSDMQGPATSILPFDVGDLTLGGRIRRPLDAASGTPACPVGTDLQVLFPTQLLGLGLHPVAPIETALALGYARWLTEVHLPQHPDARGMLYMPMRDPDACLRVVRECGERPGVVGAFVTTAGFPQVHENRHMHLYAELQERGLALGFHPTPVWLERPTERFDRYLPVWALGNVFGQCVHLMNWVLHGLPERFPKLRCVFYEAGIAWLTFISHRMDQKYLERPSEAPLLRERPSHYVRRCFFSTQPREQYSDAADLEPQMRFVGCERFVYASNFPQWDFDTTGTIEELPFLSQAERRAILGENAARLFALR